MLASKQLGTRQKLAIAADRIVHRQPVTAADDVILQAVTRRRVHRAGAGVGGDMLAQDHRHLARIERVPELHALERPALAVGHDAVFLDAITRHGRLDQWLGEEQPFRALRAVALQQLIFEFRVQRHRVVRRQRPRRRGPDRNADRSLTFRMFTATDEFGLVGDREAHVNRRRGAIGVLHLGLGQRRAAVNAPVHRLVAARDVAGRQDAPERADDVGLEAEIHGEIRPHPIADHAQALEILALALDLYARIVAAGTAEFRCFHLHAGLADFFSTACSIGNPWQSQPGTYGASKPASVRDLTMMSLRILLTAWPR